MHAKELAAATVHLAGLRLEDMQPLTLEERAEWNDAVRRRARIRKGAKVVPVSIEQGLLEEATRFAEANGISRSELIARGLRAVMGNGKRSGAKR
jgi:hypothetical protein